MLHAVFSIISFKKDLKLIMYTSSIQNINTVCHSARVTVVQRSGNVIRLSV